MASVGPRRVIGTRRPRRNATIPDSILNDPDLAAATAVLPPHYSFEIHKTVWKLKEAVPPARKVALQLPEGLLMYACAIGDILERFAGVEGFVVLGDVTYGACCVDDLTARAIGCDFLVHYGHSCLVPVAVTNNKDKGKEEADNDEDLTTTLAWAEQPIRTLYVFVEIGIDVPHLVACVQANFGATPSQPLTVMGTIQFVTAIHEAAANLKDTGFTDVLVPQAKPLSPAETLGCTSPRLFEKPASPGASAQPRQGILVFVADGRFHLEAAMIHNPQLAAYRYDPYGKVITRERYSVDTMKKQRLGAITKAKGAKSWGIILGTLGRQGNPAILGYLRRVIKSRGKRCMLVLLSEVFPAKLALFTGVEAWVQVACPRLSIDWGEAFKTAPLLTPYEALVCLDDVEWQKDVYPMDYYSDNSGPWTNRHYATRDLDAVPKAKS